MSARILVVDDIQANRRLMQAKLEAKYYTVLLAENGPQALDVAARERPHIILLDVMMPGMDGYEVCRRLKNHPVTRHIPVIMLTALTDSDSRLRGLEAGADDFLSKPVDDFSLIARLDAISRYNAVSGELRRREASSNADMTLSATEQDHLSRPASILVIDGDNAEAQKLTQALQSAGHDAHTWLDSTQADLRLPDVELILLAFSNQAYDPLKLCAQLNATERPRDFVIIVTCDPSDQKRAAEALHIGASDLVFSPVNPQELQARVRTQIRRQRYIDILRKRVDRGLELSYIDHLTGLYNRRHMLMQLQTWMNRASGGGSPVSIAAFDIDHFKQINDQFGHEAGDDVLKQFAFRLRANIRPKDIACRVGGEEFLVIMPETAADVACFSAERIRRAIALEPFDIERSKTSVKITVSAGVAPFSMTDDVPADFLHRADQALYRAKQNGRNRIESVAA